MLPPRGIVPCRAGFRPARLDLANDGRGTLLLSIHFNGRDDPSLSGSTIYYDDARPFSRRSQYFAGLVERELSAALRGAGYAAADRGVQTDRRAVGLGQHFYVLGPDAVRPSQIPGVLAEGLFVTNPRDAAQLRDPRTQDAVARAHARGAGLLRPDAIALIVRCIIGGNGHAWPLRYPRHRHRSRRSDPGPPADDDDVAGRPSPDCRERNAGAGRRVSPPRHALTLVLVVLVLVGGICPALYGPILPHAHLIIGGPPPADWEHHTHVNPLAVFFRSPAGAAATDADDDSPTVPTEHAVAGRVVSLYDGNATIVLSLLALFILVPHAVALAPPRGSGALIAVPPRMGPQVREGPAPPPPRPS